MVAALVERRPHFVETGGHSPNVRAPSSKTPRAAAAMAAPSHGRLDPPVRSKAAPPFRPRRRRRMMQVRPFILAAAVLAASLSTLTAASPAIARDRGYAVAFSDLNLASAAGRATLDRRVERAARHLCGTPFINELDFNAAISECRNDVVAAARAQRDVLAGGGQLAELRLTRTVRAAN
jgi:UrcA family protein